MSAIVSANGLSKLLEAGDTPSSADFNDLVHSFVSKVSTNGTGAVVSSLGADAIGHDIFLAEGTASAVGHLGQGGEPGLSLSRAATTASAQGHLGVGAIGNELLEAAATASAHAALGGNTVGIELYNAETTASAIAQIGGVQNAASTAQAADPAVSASAVFLSPDNMRYSPYGVRAYVEFTCAAAVQQSQRVSSVTHNAKGLYTIKWAPALPTANYSWMGGCAVQADVSAGSVTMNSNGSVAPTVSALTMSFESVVGQNVDPNNQACVAVFCSGQ